MGNSYYQYPFGGLQRGNCNTGEAGNLVPRSVGQDLSIYSIIINETQIHAETFGNSNDAMVIFLHGGPGSGYKNGLKAKYLMKIVEDDGFSQDINWGNLKNEQKHIVHIGMGWETMDMANRKCIRPAIPKE